MSLKSKKTEKKHNAISTPQLPLRTSAMLLSRREVTVSGCRRIVEYGSSKIRLSVHEGEITVDGRGLTVYTYRGDELTVRGWLTGIYFDDRLGKESVIDDTAKNR